MQIVFVGVIVLVLATITFMEVGQTVF